MCATYFQTDCSKIRNTGTEISQKINSYVERNYVSWNLGRLICIDWVLSKSAAVRSVIGSVWEGFALEGRITAFIGMHLGWNQCLRIERCAQQCHKTVKFIKAVTLRSKCSLQCAIITEISIHPTSSQEGKTFVTWANPKWLSGNDSGGHN
jgi:hypothetical protein